MTIFKYVCIKPLLKGYFNDDIGNIKINQIVEIIFFSEYFKLFFDEKSKNLANVTKEVFFYSFIEINKWRELRINKILEN